MKPVKFKAICIDASYDCEHLYLKPIESYSLSQNVDDYYDEDEEDIEFIEPELDSLYLKFKNKWVEVDASTLEIVKES